MQVEIIADIAHNQMVLCDNCGIPFYRSPANIRGKQKFCSCKCWGEYQKRATRERIDSLKGEAPRCACGCDRPVRFNYQRNRWNKYLLSHQLKKNHQQRAKKKEVLNETCDWCGKRFHESPSRKKRKLLHSFCTRKCYGEWRAHIFRGENNPNWKGGHEYNYGPNWKKQRKKALERDNYTCKKCGKSMAEIGREPDVHHIIPFREFSLKNYEKANDVKNLVTLCKHCHVKVEVGILKLSL